jgi:chemotaxis methyl-accepting protein methylase
MAHSPVVHNLGKASMAIWSKLPPPLLESPMFRALGHAIHKTVCRFAPRDTAGSTWFLRNPPLLSAIAEQIHTMRPAGEVRICVIGCSTGAEVYSVLWVLRKRYPQIPVSMVAMDLSPVAVEIGQAGKYPVNSLVFRSEQMDDATRQEMFDREGEHYIVKPWLREGVRWMVADATDPEIAARIGAQDVVLANNFLVHMKDNAAMDCMIHLARLVRPGGLFVCRGVDLDLREEAAEQLGLRPVTSYIEEIHDAEPNFDARSGWPWRYWGLEPIDKSRANWTQRYAAMFIAPSAETFYRGERTGGDLRG